jgi:hypothetical protein
MKFIYISCQVFVSLRSQKSETKELTTDISIKGTGLIPSRPSLQRTINAINFSIFVRFMKGGGGQDRNN